MIWRSTRAGLSTLTLLSVALLLGVLSGRAELFLVSVPLALRLLAIARRPAAPRYTLTHELSSTRLLEGEEAQVTVTLTAETTLPQIEVFEPLPPSAQLTSGYPRRVLTLAAGATERWSYHFHLPERGRYVLGTVHARSWTPSGLGMQEAVLNAPQTLNVYPRAAPLRRLPAPLRTQASSGNYVSPLVGDGIEPGEIRLFAPGDRIKHVNWRASLRRDRLYVTRYQQERNADVVLMLDTLSQAGTGSATTVDASLRAAASLAAAYLARKDRVGLIEYGGVLRWVRPGSGRAHFERLLATLVRAEVTFTYVAKDLGLVPPRILPPEALVIAISSLLDARFLTALGDLAGRGFDLIVLAVDPVPMTRASLAPSVRVDTACRLWTLERQSHLDAVAARGLRVVPWSPDEPIDGAGPPRPAPATPRARRVMRAFVLAPVVLLAAVPVLWRPTATFAGIAAAAALLCAAGVLLRWRPLVTGGASLVLLLYALTLFGAPTRLLSAIVLGVSLVLVLDAAEFVRRFHGAVVTGRALARQVRHWTVNAAVGVLVTAALASVAALVTVGGPPALFPVLAAVGALAALAGIAGAVSSAQRSDAKDSRAKEEQSW